MNRLARLAFFLTLLTFTFAREAAAATCGNGTCEVGEDAGNCPDDCLCYNTASIDYALCCCCQNDPAPQGECTPKAICNYPEIGGCCCAQFDPSDPFSCLFCVDKEEIPGWCAGGIGAFQGMGSCGGGVAPACPDTELTDDYIDGVNVRTRCAATSVPIGVVEGGGDGFAIEVSVTFNEGRPPPEEIGTDFPNAKTGPYGKGGWLSVDKIFTDEGVYWESTTAAGELSSTGVIKGQRSDRNGNGYVGYTMHGPFGSRTYDYPVVLDVHGYSKPVGVFRSEPFDGQFLLVEDPTGNDTQKKARKYTLFRYPNGPFEIYDWQLSNPGKPSPFDANDRVRSASLLSEMNTSYGPPSANAGNRWIKVWRGAQQSNAVDYITGPPFTKWDLKLTYGLSQPDGGMLLTASRSPGNIAITMAFTQKFDFRPETFTSPGRQADDLTTFEWDDWRIKSVSLALRDKALKTVYGAKATMERDEAGLEIVKSIQTNELFGFPEGEETTLFEGCDLSGAPFEGTTVSTPHDIHMSFEYGDETVQHRLIAQTHATGTRTQYRFNDDQTEPRGELTDAVNVAGPTPPEMLGTGFGTHIEWDLIVQVPMDATLFRPGTFAGPATSKGVPVSKQLVRMPDGLVLRKLEDHDPAVFLPRRITDERGMLHAFTYHADTGQLETYKKQGVTRRFVRSIEQDLQPPDAAGFAAFISLQSIEVWLEGANQKKAFLGKTSWDLQTGRVYRRSTRALRLDPDAPTTGAVKEMKIDKRILRDIQGAPVRVQTFLDGALTGETTMGWDPRFMGPAKVTTMVNGNMVSSAQPMAGTGVDGFGDMAGNWQVSGPGEQLAMFAELDPLGNLRSATTNGIGDKVTRVAGPDPQTLKTTISRLSPAGEIPEMEELETTGTTELVCK